MVGSVLRMGEGIPDRADALVSRVPFFYGWVMLPVVMATGIATTPGQTYVIAVFNPYLRSSLSLSHSELSGAYMAGTLLAALPMTFVGVLMDRFGPRRTLAGVVILLGLVCAAASQATGLVTLFLAFLGLRMLGQGAMGLLGINTLALWFNRRLGFASGISGLGLMVALSLVPPLSLWLIRSFGWRWAYVLLGAGVWVLMLPLLAVFFRNRPEDVGQTPDGLPEDGRVAGPPAPDSEGGREVSFRLAEALRTRSYWILAFATALQSMVGTGIMFHMVQLFVDRGLSETDAAGAFATIAVSMSAARFVGGILADRVPLNILLFVSMAGKAGSVVILIWMSDFWSAHTFAAVMGVSFGLGMAVGMTVWVRYYGRAHLGKIQGSLTTVGVAASSLGPFLMGSAYDLFGGYDEVLWGCAGLAAASTALALLAIPPKAVSQETL